MVSGAKGSCEIGSHDLCKDPKLGPLSGDAYGMVPGAGSPAIDSGKGVGGTIPDHDHLRRKRPRGAGWTAGHMRL